jgi:hypothetical protein
LIIAPREAGLCGGELAYAVQGVAAGIGFIGVGIGPPWVSVLSAACAWLILSVFAEVGKKMGQPDRP